MHSTSATISRRMAGFTLVEILIIAPIVLLIVSGFIALMITMVGDVLQTRDHGALTYDIQYSLDRVEQDTHLSTRFLSTTGALQTPQGSDSNFTGTAAFTSGANKLIFNQPATDADPNSPSRRLIYYAMQTNPCGPNESFNRIFTQKVVYFIKAGSLWRRSLVPDWNTNSTPDANTICNDYSISGRPWARNSCSPGYSATRCETNDEEIMQNIDSFTTKYYSTPGGSNDLGAANAENAAAIEVTINGSKTTAGNPYSASASLRATKINSLDTDVRDIETPVVTHSLPRPDKVTFAWGSVLGAVSYNTWYNINGGAWQYLSVNNSTLSRTVDANRGDTVSFRVSAVTTTGTSQEGLDAATMPLWTPLDLQSGWKDYGTGGYSTAAFTKSPDGTVFLKGVIKAGTTDVNTVIANLPDGYRPVGRLVYPVGMSTTTNGRIDVDSNGDILVYIGASGYMSLDGIAFLPSSSPYTWTNYNFPGTWSNYGSTWETVHEAKDSVGRVHIQGLAKPGSTANNTTIATPPSSTGLIPTGAMHFPSGTGAGFWADFWIWNGAAEVVKRGTDAVGYMALQAIYYPGSTGSWTALSRSSGWVNYGNVTGTDYPLLQYTKASDKVCTVRGVLKSGTATNPTLMATLPAECAPPEKLILTTVASSDVYARVDVDIDGKVYFVKGSSTWTALNFSFIVN